MLSSRLALPVVQVSLEGRQLADDGRKENVLGLDLGWGEDDPQKSKSFCPVDVDVMDIRTNIPSMITRLLSDC